MTTSSIATAFTPAGTADSWAEVRADAGVTRYRRSGAGPAVLLLDTREDAGALWPELLRELSDRFRFTLPEVPAGTALTGRWLAGFLEGLGGPPVHVIAVGPCTIPAFELAMRGAEQVSGVVLVPQEPGDAEPGEVMSARVPGAPVPMLVVRRQFAPERAVALIRAFLAGDDSAAPG
jgi:hypothetical protein